MNGISSATVKWAATVATRAMQHGIQVGNQTAFPGGIALISGSVTSKWQILHPQQRPLDNITGDVASTMVILRQRSFTAACWNTMESKARHSLSMSPLASVGRYMTERPSRGAPSPGLVVLRRHCRSLCSQDRFETGLPPKCPRLSLPATTP